MAALLLLLAFSGCALKQGDSWPQERELVMKSLEDAHLKSAKLETQVKQLDQRVLELQKTVTQQQAHIMALTATQLASKRRAGPLNRASGAISPKTTAELTRQLDRIAANIDADINGEPGAGKAGSSEERDTYTAAYLAYKSSKFDESISTFRALLAKYPDGEYSDQAYFWLGEGLLAKHRPADAAKAFNAVVMDYPRSGKHAMALLRLANTYNELNRKGDAKAALQRLLREHPDSPAVGKAETLLHQLTEKSK